MTVRPELLEILVCPRCQGKVSYDSGKQAILCMKCELLYPVQNDVPVMLEDEAFPIRQGGESMTGSGKRVVAVFEITEGKNKGQIVKLPEGTCKAIGRSLDDINKTQVFSMDFTMSLDDFTKKLIMNYIAKKSPQDKKIAQETSTDSIGSFKRLPDLVLDDPAISRLHAMMFHDSNGAGVLDLVSKNGTFVNGEEVESKSLQNGDLVEVGGTKMVFTFK
ncbi:MAG: FHA domain-containing protein [Deltaproteobacteria bacterium]|nr:FHA domain-containing protein [Deltaproteobacteria bacterium]